MLDTLRQVVSDEPVPPTQLQSRTPKDLETICLKCLHKEPAKRYATALALAEDLARFQAGATKRKSFTLRMLTVGAANHGRNVTLAPPTLRLSP